MVSFDVDSTATVRDVIGTAIERYGSDLEDILLNKDGSISGNLIVMLNGHDTDLLRGLDTPVQRNDEIAVLPHVQGGGR
jgi:molybdopterin converting factor small subunit